MARKGSIYTDMNGERLVLVGKKTHDNGVKEYEMKYINKDGSLSRGLVGVFGSQMRWYKSTGKMFKSTGGKKSNGSYGG